MKRADAIAWMRFAGYHSDSKSFTRLLLENRVARPVADDAWRQCVRMRQTGVGCGCAECTGSRASISY